MAMLFFYNGLFLLPVDIESLEFFHNEAGIDPGQDVQEPLQDEFLDQQLFLHPSFQLGADGNTDDVGSHQTVDGGNKGNGNTFAQF